MKKLGFFLLLLSFSSLNAQVINSVYKAQTYEELAAPIREATRALNYAEDKLVTYYEKAISAIKNQDYYLAKLYIDKCYELNRRFNGNLCSQEDLNKLSDYYNQQQNTNKSTYNSNPTVENYRTAANQGNAIAQYNLGLCYCDGNGVTKDINQAVYWWKKSAMQGVAEAQYNLGCCYDKGEGTPKDINTAKYWYQKAAQQGIEQAKEALKELEAAGY